MLYLSSYIVQASQTDPRFYTDSQLTVLCLYLHRVNIVQWSEDCYETQLIERTINACEGNVDIVIDFAANPRSMNRSLKCLSKVSWWGVCVEAPESRKPSWTYRYFVLVSWGPTLTLWFYLQLHVPSDAWPASSTLLGSFEFWEGYGSNVCSYLPSS